MKFLTMFRRILWLTLPIGIALLVDAIGYGVCSVSTSSFWKVVFTLIQFPGSIVIGFASAMITFSLVFKWPPMVFFPVLLIELILISMAVFVLALPIEDIRPLINAR